jgi:hypothetical protein
MKIARYFFSRRNYMKGIRFHLKEFSEIRRSQEKKCLFIFHSKLFSFSFFFSFFSVLYFSNILFYLASFWFLIFLAKNVVFLLTFYVLSLKKYESCVVLHLDKNVRKFPNWNWYFSTFQKWKKRKFLNRKNSSWDLQLQQVLPTNLKRAKQIFEDFWIATNDHN